MWDEGWGTTRAFQNATRYIKPEEGPRRVYDRSCPRAGQITYANVP